jgi:hypothetical protein
MTKHEMLTNLLNKSGWIITDQVDESGAQIVVADANA